MDNVIKSLICMLVQFALVMVSHFSAYVDQCVLMAAALQQQKVSNGFCIAVLTFYMYIFSGLDSWP